MWFIDENISGNFTDWSIGGSLWHTFLDEVYLYVSKSKYSS